jgi:hypothetical protein
VLTVGADNVSSLLFLHAVTTIIAPDRATKVINLKLKCFFITIENIRKYSSSAISRFVTSLSLSKVCFKLNFN